MAHSGIAPGGRYTHKTHGVVCVLAVHPEIGICTVQPPKGPALAVKADLLVPHAPVSVRPRDCYRPFEVRMKFGTVNEKGELVPLSRITLYRWRKEGLLEWVEINSRCILYPKESVHRLLAERGRVRA